MIEEVKQFMTSDGRTFGSREEAEDHAKAVHLDEQVNQMTPWIEKYLKKSGRFETMKRLPAEVQRYRQFTAALLTYQVEGDKLEDVYIPDAPPRKAKADKDQLLTPPEDLNTDNQVPIPGGTETTAKKPAAKKAAKKTAAKAK